LEQDFYNSCQCEIGEPGQAAQRGPLYLSLPLMRLLNINELRAVVGHGFSHFRGSDTVYSLKLSQVYRGLSNAINSLRDEEAGLFGLARLPAISMLFSMLEVFSRNESRISREREFEADAVGSGISSAKARATALCKVAVYTTLWSRVRNRNLKRLNPGKVTANLSMVYEDSYRFDVSHTAMGKTVD
jgi:Zn-dependent protease with chaperone function